MYFFRFKFNGPCLGPIVELNYFLLSDAVYRVYVSVRDSNRSVICINCCVAMGANGGGDVSSVVW